MIFRLAPFACVAIAAAAVPATAAAPRETLTNAAFLARTKAEAIAQVAQALAQANAILARDPGDSEARLQQAIAVGYRAKLKHSLPDAKEARRLLETLVAAEPRNAEAHAALAGWHMDAVAQLGGFMARTMLGAKRELGLQQLDIAMRLGGNRALFPAMAALTRIQTDKGDVATARSLAERGAAAATPTPLDRVLQRSSIALLAPLRAGDGRQAQALASRLLPFGRLD